MEERIFGEAGRQTVRTVKTALMALFIHSQFLICIKQSGNAGESWVKLQIFGRKYLIYAATV